MSNLLLDISGSHLRIAKLIDLENERFRIVKNTVIFKKTLDHNEITNLIKNAVGLSYAGLRLKDKVYIPNLDLWISLKEFEGYAENDMNLVALAYHNYKSVVALGIGTGIGVGYFNQRPFFGNFGEIGHILLNGRSVESLIAYDFHHKKFEDLKEEEKEMYLRYFLQLIDATIKTFWPEAIVIHGAVGNIFMDHVKDINASLLNLNITPQAFREIYQTNIPKFLRSTSEDVFKGLIVLMKYYKEDYFKFYGKEK